MTWQVEGRDIRITVDVPAATTATIVFRDRPGRNLQREPPTAVSLVRA